MSLEGRSGTAGRGEPSASLPRASLKDLDSEGLVRSCLAGAPGAWEEFLQRYANLIYSTIHGKVGLADADREDAFQNAVVAIYTHLGALRDPERLVPWIIRIAYRHGVNRIRVRARRRETPIDEVPDGELREPWGEGKEDPPGDLSRRDLALAQQAQAAMELLPPRCRELLRLLFYEDPPLDYEEISRRQGIPIGSIGPTRARCLEKMRRLYERRGWGG